MLLASTSHRTSHRLLQCRRPRSDPFPLVLIRINYAAIKNMDGERQCASPCCMERTWRYLLRSMHRFVRCTKKHGACPHDRQERNCYLELCEFPESLPSSPGVLCPISS